jgi:thioesterase domain-containing protein
MYDAPWPVEGESIERKPRGTMSSAEIAVYHDQGSLPPLIMVQSWPSEAEKLAVLAEHLGPSQPLYGLLAPDAATARRQTTMSKRVDYCVELVKRLPVEPPYHVFGWSFGGVTALELGRALGDDVGMIAMLDSWFTRTYRLSTRLRYASISWQTHHPAKPLMAFAADLLRHDLREQRRRMRVTREWQRATVREWLGQGPARNQFDSCMHGIQKTVGWYRPEPIEHPVTFVSAKETLTRQESDPAAVWAATFVAGFERILIDGGHFTMWDQPYLTGLGEELQAAAARADERFHRPVLVA